MNCRRKRTTFKKRVHQNAFADLNKLLQKFENMDPNTESFSLIQRNVHDTLSGYKQIYDEKNKQTKQTTMDTFLKRVSGKSLRRYPKEGTVTTDDCSTYTVLPIKNFQWDEKGK